MKLLVKQNGSVVIHVSDLGREDKRRSDLITDENEIKLKADPDGYVRLSVALTRRPPTDLPAKMRYPR